MLKKINVTGVPLLLLTESCMLPFTEYISFCDKVEGI